MQAATQSDSSTGATFNERDALGRTTAHRRIWSLRTAWALSFSLKVVKPISTFYGIAVTALVILPTFS